MPVEDAQRIRVTFAGATSDILPWSFKPQQREVKVLPGETALVSFLNCGCVLFGCGSIRSGVSFQFKLTHL